jgi:ketosteroid isomerase-like protein
MPDSPSETFRRWAAANVAADMDAWAPLVADDFTYVHSRANIETKAEMVEAFTNGRRYGGWEIEDLSERLYPGCAVLNGIGHLLAGRAEAPTRLDVRFTATLVPAGDGWQLAAMQTTRLPE